MHPLLRLYTLSTGIVRCLFLLLSLVSPRVRNFLRLRQESLAEIQKKAKEINFLQTLKGKKVYWFHGASVGELEQAKSMGRELKKQEKNSYLIVSWMSDSVKESNLRDSPADFHIPLPLDSPHAYREIFSLFHPQKVLVFSWDTWPWFLYRAKEAGSKLYLVCASLSEESGRMGSLARKLTQIQFSWLDGIYPTHPLHEERIRLIASSLENPVPIESLGDTRFDSVIEKMEIVSPPPSFSEFLLIWQKVFRLQGGKPILFASTYESCEEGICRFIRETARKSLPLPPFWIFPHKIESDRIASLKKKLQKSVSYFRDPPEIEFYSSFLRKIDRNLDREFPKILLFDEMGILAYAYQCARFTYVGGGLHFRIHNTIEPAYWALPILCGERIQNASEAVLMKELGGLATVSNPKEMAEVLQEWNSLSERQLKEMGEKNKNFVLENKGATSRIYKRLWG